MKAPQKFPPSGNRQSCLSQTPGLCWLLLLPMDVSHPAGTIQTQGPSVPPGMVLGVLISPPVHLLSAWSSFAHNRRGNQGAEHLNP